jgi:MFS family permease
MWIRHGSTSTMTLLVAVLLLLLLLLLLPPQPLFVASTTTTTTTSKKPTKHGATAHSKLTTAPSFSLGSCRRGWKGPLCIPRCGASAAAAAALSVRATSENAVAVATRGRKPHAPTATTGVYNAPLAVLPSSATSTVLPVVASDAASSSTITSLWRIVYVVSFLMALSSSLVALAPVQALQQRLNMEQATQVLSALSATAALLEITLSSVMGSILDVTGRKCALWTIVATVVSVQLVTAVSPTVVTIAVQRLVGMVAVGFFFLATQTIITDLVFAQTTSTTATTNAMKSATSSSLVSAAMGQQMAISGLGFLLGILAAGQVSEYSVSVVYAMAASVGAVALLLIQFSLVETLPVTKVAAGGRDGHVPSPKSPSVRWMLQSPLSCTRLLTRHGPKVRTLGLLLMLMSLPSFMGDFFQVFAKQEWQLSTKSFSTFLALYGIVGIAANTASSLLVKAWGIRRFTAVAILSRLFATVATIVFGFRGTVTGLIVGFLGSAQAIGIVAALISEGTKSGLPQGEMAGERAALVALLKVIGPIWYSTLYLQGQRWMQTHYLPFFFNITLSIMALVMSQIHL